MQVKVVIGTIAFMLTMIILGYAALREPLRLEEFTGAAEGRSIEMGAKIFSDNCVGCHGVEGRAQVGCTNPNTGDETCLGLPLNNYFLLCEDTPKRLLDLGWEGTTENFVKKTVAAGRGAIMPAWLNEFGGPMRPDQVQNVTNYVLNWQSEELCAEPPVTFPWPGIVDPAESYGGMAQDFQSLTEPVVIEEGNPELGAAAYQSYNCNTCHGQPEEPGSATVGPWLGEISTVGAERVEGYSAQDYIYESILNPNAHIAEECPTGPCNDPSLMPGDFANRMSNAPNSPQDMANILAYLMGDSYQYP